MKTRMLFLLCALLLLTGCAPLLQREYSTAEPHSSKFWESEAAGTLRAENHQDIVNDLLLLIGQHTETATIRLYNYEDDLAVADMLEQATMEIQQETPMGAYAVEYITSSRQAQRGYYEISVQIGYRRTAEQLQAVMNATSPEAIYSLLEDALDDGKTELAVRIGYWGLNGRETVENAMLQLREERELTETPPWLVYLYPAGGPAGLVEFLLAPSENLLAAVEAAGPAEGVLAVSAPPPEEETLPDGETDAEAGAETEAAIPADSTAPAGGAAPEADTQAPAEIPAAGNEASSGGDTPAPADPPPAEGAEAELPEAEVPEGEAAEDSTEKIIEQGA